MDEATPRIETCDTAAGSAPLGAAAFRDAMARLVSGVAIVTCLNGGTPRGLLISSLTALSIEPPRILFCVGKAASSHDTLLKITACNVAILSEGDREEARRFADTSRTHERFAGANWRAAPGEAPTYDDALANLSGGLHRLADAGTHSVFVLDVASTTTRDGAPLAYFNRDFRHLRLDQP